MADAPEVVPESLSYQSPPPRAAGRIQSPGSEKLGFHTPPTSSTPVNADAEKQLKPTGEAETPKHAVERAEDEESNPKFGYARDDRAGSGMESVRQQTAREDEKVERQRILSGNDEGGARDGDEGMKRDDGEPTEDWHFGFWDLFKPASLGIESLLCPCVIAGRTHTRLHEPLDTHMSSTNVFCVSCCFLSCTTIGALPLYCFMTTAQRREIRYRYHIRGNNGDDCWKATFCVWCSLVQEEKEVVWRKEQKAKAGSSTEQLGRRTDAMTYSSDGRVL